jgi:hypothetical protein
MQGGRTRLETFSNRDIRLMHYWSVDFQQVTHSLDQTIDSKGLLHKVIRPGCSKPCHFILFDHTGDTDDPNRIQ